MASESYLTSRALDLIVALHRQGLLSEGQCCTALGLERVAFRKIADDGSRPYQLGQVEAWMKDAMRFIDLCEADVADYSDNGLFEDAERLLERGFALFGGDENSSLATIEHAHLALRARQA